MPARHPDDSRGVTSSPPRSTNTLAPVPPHRWPAVLASRASSPPFATASASATTFSAYDVVLSPATAERSLRAQGERTARPAGLMVAGPAATTTVWAPGVRPDPSGPTPAVTVMRSRP